MLVLYVLTFAALKIRTNQIEIQLRKWEEIQKIEKSINEIDKTERYFSYSSEYKKHILKINIGFERGSADIDDIGEAQQADLIGAGNMIIDLINSFGQQDNVKYLVIIEGQASKDGWSGNYKLSYERALSLLGFWQKKGIRIDTLDNCEMLIAGSGEGGIPRLEPDEPPNNQRFLIHIIPKVGDINVN